MALFLAVAPSFRSLGNTGTILYEASAIGIMAVGVSLLMVGGEFDLSTGVAATASGICAALTAWNFGLNVWIGVLAALLERGRTGRGQVVRTSLLASIVGVHAFQGTRWTVAGEVGRARHAAQPGGGGRGSPPPRFFRYPVTTTRSCRGPHPAAPSPPGQDGRAG